MNYHKRISENIAKFNETDKRIYEKITELFDDFHDLVIAEIAQELYVSPNAIIRFAKKLGYTGFSEMKYSIIQEVASKKAIDAPKNNSTLDNVERIIRATEITLNVNSEAFLKKATEALIKHKKIVFFSLGITQNYVKSFIQQIQVFNKLCIMNTDRDNAVSLAKNIDDDFLVFFVSAFGKNDVLIECASILKQKEVPIIVLTGLNQNHLQEFADISLYGYAQEFYIDSIDMSSRHFLGLTLEMLLKMMVDYYEIENEWKKL